MNPDDEGSGGLSSARLYADRLVKAGGGLGAFLIGYLLLSFARGAYTDWLWFSELGFSSVYRTVLITQVSLFIVGLVVSTVALVVAYRAAYRAAWGPTLLPFPPSTYDFIRRGISLSWMLLVAVLSFSFAAELAERYELFLRAANAAQFGIEDPQFSIDVGFYVFTLPMLHAVQGWLMGLVMVVIFTTALLYLLIYSVRGMNPAFTPASRFHLAVAGAALMLTIAPAHFLDRYETLFSPFGAVTGATYADVNARLPGLILLTLAAVAAAGIMLFSLRVANLRQSVRLIIAAFGLWVITALLAGLLWPMLTQRLAVSPSELQRERPYIERNIEWTRRGFDLAPIDVRPYDVREETLAADVAANPETIQNIRLWDPRPLEAVLNQLQHLRLYYSFLDVDVDRYVVDGDYRQVLLGAREMFQNGLDETAQNWVNRTLVYTHGYGMVMSPATDFTQAGQPNFIVRDVPPVGAFEIEQPRIYYGESYGIDSADYAGRLSLPPEEAAAVRPGVVTNDAIIVNTTEPQFDRPATGASDAPEFIDRYDGAGGVSLSGIVRRAAFAWEMLDVNIVLSRQLTPESRVLYRRNIRDRVHTIAPFLELDDDPYLVVDDGRLYWVQDAFTTTDRLPYSRRIDAARVGANGDFDSFERPFNYVRNTVKVVIDAYDGSVTFYTIEAGGPDPILQVYRNIFPSLFTPIEAMPPGLRRHIRYPEELLRAQADAFLQYHMTDVKEFFLKEDEWQLAQEVVGVDVIVDPDTGDARPRNRTITPYYVIMKLAGEQSEEFVLILPFTPKDKPNLVAWMAARSDGEQYGEIIVFEFPKDRLFNGPSQIEARIDNDPVISEQFTLWNQSGSQVFRGNLLVIPIGEALLYAEPIYLQAESLTFPELKRVVLATNEKVVMEPTLNAAVAALLAGERPAATGGPSVVEDGISRAELRRVLNELLQALESLESGAEGLEEGLNALRELAGGGSG